MVPSSEDEALLGIVYDSVAFPQHDGAGSPCVRLTVGAAPPPPVITGSLAPRGGLTPSLCPCR